MRHRLKRSGCNRLRFLRLSVCSLAAVLCTSFTAAQNSPRSTEQFQEPPLPRYRVLTLKQERAIVNAAWDHRLSGDTVQDCSHVVNQIYSDAGYEYPYASSFDLYRGTPNFVRVKSPQPGDLVAWPGHVGIVINPKHHSFYSLVSTGLEAQDYRGAYWRRRGTPRFYRYIMPSDARAPGAVFARGAASGERRQNADVHATQVETAGVTQDPPELTAASVIEKQIDKDGRSISSADPELYPGRNRGNAPPQLAQPPASRRGSSSESVQHGGRAESEVDSASSTLFDHRSSSSIPATIAIETASTVPSRDEIADSILALSNTAADSLAAGNALKPVMPVVVVDQLSVERVDIKKNRGWAHLKIDSRVSISSEGVNFKQRHDKVRWEVRRGESGWTATVPPDRIYVSRDAAVRALSARLAQLSASDAAAQHDGAVLGQEARLANLLSALLANR